MPVPYPHMAKDGPPEMKPPWPTAEELAEAEDGEVEEAEEELDVKEEGEGMT